MPERTVVIGSSGGLHARPARLFVEAAGRQPVPVFISRGGAPVPARSMLSVLSLGAGFGAEVILSTDDAAGAEEALDELANLLARDLDAPEDAPEPDNG